MNTPFNDNDYLPILEGIANSNQQSFRALFDLFANRLMHFSQVIVKNKEAAVEVVDDVFVKLWKNRHEATHIQNIRVYLYTAVKNASLNYLSKKSKEVIKDPFDFMDIHMAEDQNPEQLMITDEMLKKIESAIDELPPRCKIIFKLVREDGLRYKDVAQVLNISINTVDAQMVIAVHRISQKLKDQLGIFRSPPPPKKPG